MLGPPTFVINVLLTELYPHSLIYDIFCVLFCFGDKLYALLASLGLTL